MGIVVILGFKVKPDKLAETKKFLKKILVDTRAYTGCEGLEVYTNDDDPTEFVFHERWQSKDLYQKYLAWRTSNGTMEEFGAMMAGAPSIRYFNREDV